MKAIVFDQPGSEDVLRLGDVAPPVLGPGELRIRVAATAVNRADLLQRKGLYPPPPDASPILGLECAGTVAEVGPGVSAWTTGERVMALLPGGGYAEEVTVPAGCAMPVPEPLSLAEAAAVPEVFLTCFLTLFRLGHFPDGGVALVHGGGSGVGTAAIQMIKAVGGKIVVTAGSDDKCRKCEELGADVAVNYNNDDFVSACHELTSGRGVDVVLDSIGGPYLTRNLLTLGQGGRMIVIATMGGKVGELDLGQVLRKRISVIGSTLRSRTVEEKSAIVSGFVTRFLPLFDHGVLHPVVDRVLPLEQAAEAHRVVARSEHFGKVVLKVRWMRLG